MPGAGPDVGELAGRVAFGVMHVVRTPREELMMRELFGQEYGEYSRRTGRFVPRFRKERAWF